MKTKIFNVFGLFFKIVGILMMVLSLLGIVLVILDQFNLNFEPLKVIYVLLPELILPFIYFVFGSFNWPSDNNLVAITTCVFVIVLLFMFIIVRDISMSTKDATKESRKTSFIWSAIGSLIFLAYNIYGLFIVCLKNYDIGTFLSSKSFGFMSSTAMYVKMIVVISIFIVICIGFIIGLLTILTKRPKSKITGVSVYFYSSQYEEKRPEDKTKNVSNEISEEDSKDIDEASSQSKKLIKRIMELNKMKERGEIDEVEFTRLRQIAIRRYRK